VVVKPPSQNISDQLLGDLDNFSRQLDEQEQALKQAAEAEQAARKAREAEEAARRAEAERQRVAAEAAAAAAAAKNASVPRGGALDALRRQAATAGPRVDPAMERARAMLALDQDLQAAYRYLAQFAAEANDVHPASSGAYEYPYLGKLPVMTLSDLWCDTRPTIVEEKSYSGYISLRYNVAPQPPFQVRLQRDDIPFYLEFLKPHKTEYEFNVEAKNDFGQPLRGVLIVKGKFPCEVMIHGDYTAMGARVEATNVRRYGRWQCLVPGAEVKDLGDELARYMLGIDDDFGKRLQKV
jgi:hypothetical protein